METTKMTVRVPKELLQHAKQYARDHDTTLTRLITAYLGKISLETDPLADAPIVQRLSGTLSPEVTQEDYHHYLDEKYGSPTAGSH